MTIDDLRRRTKRNKRTCWTLGANLYPKCQIWNTVLGHNFQQALSLLDQTVTFALWSIQSAI